MGYLDNTSVTVDAVLTKLGRQRLAEGNLNITKFALSDDEINYALYDTAHSLGTAYYGEAIERMPLLEAFTNDVQALTNKLITLPKNTQTLPVVTVHESAINLTQPNQTVVITPQTFNIEGSNPGGYTFTLGNTDIATIEVGESSTYTRTDGTAIPAATGNKLSGTLNGMSVRITSYSITQTQTTTLTVTGIDSGGTVTIPVTVTRDSSND